MRVRRLALAAAIVGLGALVFSSAAQACSCMKRTPEQALRESDAAVVARLVQVVPMGSYSAEYHYLVRRSFKRGEGIRAGATISVRSGINGAACGFPADEERWYGLLLHRTGDGWTGGLCGIVTPRQLSTAAAALRRGDDVAPGASGSSLSCAS